MIYQNRDGDWTSNKPEDVLIVIGGPTNDVFVDGSHDDPEENKHQWQSCQSFDQLRWIKYEVNGELVSFTPAEDDVDSDGATVSEQGQENEVM